MSLCCCAAKDKMPNQLKEYDPCSEADVGFSHKYMFAMVMDAGHSGHLLSKTQEQAENFAAVMVAQLKSSKLDVFPYISENGKDIIILIGSFEKASGNLDAPPLDVEGVNGLSPIHIFADTINFPILLNEKITEKIVMDGQPDIAGRIFPGVDKRITPYGPFQYVYGPYSCPQHEIYKLSPVGGTKTTAAGSAFDLLKSIATFGSTSTSADSLLSSDTFDDDPFTPLIRIKVMYEILRGSKTDGGSNLNIEHMIHSGDIKAFFPLHNKLRRDKLWEEWR